MIFIFISKKDSKQNQPKKPSQSGPVANNLFKDGTLVKLDMGHLGHL
jgi:hypothetical protein